MAIYHLRMSTFSRSRGQTATAAAAYRACTRIRDKRTGEVHDYKRKRGLVYDEIIIPPGGHEMSREELWNRAESMETRKNSTVAREVHVSLPVELDRGQRQELAQYFAWHLARQYNVYVDLCIHEPSKNQRKHNAKTRENPHAHLLFTTRNAQGEKTRELDEVKYGQLELIREQWAAILNASLKYNGFDV